MSLAIELQSNLVYNLDWNSFLNLSQLILMINKIRKIDLEEYKQIVVVTGAGISVASGLETYRGNGRKKINSKTENIRID